MEIISLIFFLYRLIQLVYLISPVTIETIFHGVEMLLGFNQAEDRT